MSLIKLATNIKQLIRPLQRRKLDIASGVISGGLIGGGIGYATSDKKNNALKRTLTGATIGGLAGGSWASKIAIGNDKIKKIYRTNDREFYNSNRRFATKYKQEEEEYLHKQKEQPRKFKFSSSESPIPISEVPESIIPQPTKVSKLKPLIAKNLDWDASEKYENYLHKKYGGDPYRDITGRRTVKLQSSEFYRRKFEKDNPEYEIDRIKWNLKNKLKNPKGYKYNESDLHGRHMFGSQRYISTDNIPLTPSGIKQFKRKLSKDARKEVKGHVKLIQAMQYMEDGKFRSKKGKIVPFVPAPYPKPIVKPESKHFNLDSNSMNDIKKQFREKMKLNHPDLGGNPETFREIHDEYENVTSSPWFKHISKKKRPKKKKKMGLVSLSKGNNL